MSNKRDPQLLQLQEELRLDTMRQFIEIRKAQGKTQNDISEITGILRPNICRMEGGSYNPTLDMVARMAHSVGKKVRIVFEDIE